MAKRKSRAHFHECGDPEEINKIVGSEEIDFNPVKPESEPEQPKVKTTAAFDNSRFEFLRMQIGPVQNFYQTLGNILFSLSMRLDVAEAKVENLKGFYDQLTLERALYKRYAEYCKESNLQWSEPGFVEFIREYAKEEEDAAKKL